MEKALSGLARLLSSKDPIFKTSWRGQRKSARVLLWNPTSHLLVMTSFIPACLNFVQSIIYWTVIPCLVMIIWCKSETKIHQVFRDQLLSVSFWLLFLLLKDWPSAVWCSYYNDCTFTICSIFLFLLYILFIVRLMINSYMKISMKPYVVQPLAC